MVQVGSLTCFLDEYIVQCGLTQSELARRVGCSRNTIVGLCRGHFAPSLKLAFRIQDELNYTFALKRYVFLNDIWVPLPERDVKNFEGGGKE